MKMLRTCVAAGFTLLMLLYQQKASAQEVASQPPPAATVIMDSTHATVKMVIERLREIYQKELEDNAIDADSRNVMIEEQDLNDDGQMEIFVGMSGPRFCEVAGCKVMLLDANGGKITTFSATDLPIVIGNTKTNGWKDLYIMSNGVFHTMRYKGRSYPSIPDAAPVTDGTPDNSFLRTGVAPLHHF